MSKVPENREEVQQIVDKEIEKKLFDSEFDRRKRETGKRVKLRREELGYTRADLSKVTGISESPTSFIEQGCSAPNLGTLILLCEGLQQSADYIIDLRNRNYDDVMRDSNTVPLVRKPLQFSRYYHNTILYGFYEYAVTREKSERIQK